jgi:dolichol-phosphate mannosyltransferase
MRIAIAMPIFNEADGIEETLRELDVVFVGHSVTLCLQNDCSTDETIDVIQNLNDQLNMDLIISSNDFNLGHGPTTLRAYGMALDQTPDVVLQLDSDGQYFAHELPHICDLLDQGFDVVYGIRRQRFDPKLRRLITFFLRIFLFVRFGFYQRDSNTPVRAYKPSSLSSLMKTIDSNSIIPNIFLTILASRAKLEVHNVEVGNRPRRGLHQVGTMWASASRFRSNIKLFRFVFRAFVQIIKL